MRALELCLVFVGLYWIGVPNPALWGVVAGILRIVPYVGTVVAATPAARAFLVGCFLMGGLRPLLVFLLVAGLETDHRQLC